ncbi:unnamed protein product [Boreogadus saida]
MKAVASSNDGSRPDVDVGQLYRVASEVALPARLLGRTLSAGLALLTHLLAAVVGSGPAGHFHLPLNALVLCGPLLSVWTSSHSVFANRNHFLYRKFLASAWGWTFCVAGSFVVLLSFSARRSALLSLRHLARLALTGLLWWGTGRLVCLLEDAAGTCFQPVAAAAAGGGSDLAGQPLLLLQDAQSKASCLRAGQVWRGYEVSQDTLTLCLCCLLLVEEMAAFGPHVLRAEAPTGPPAGAPLRILFLLCVLLLTLWLFLLLCLLAYFPQFPAQQLGGAIAYLGWRGLYQGWYRLKPSWFCPGAPGVGLD